MVVLAFADGIPVFATTTGEGLTIKGQNPTPAAILADIQSFPVPPLLAGSSYNYYNIIQSLVKEESTLNETQFNSSGSSQGYPLLNSGYDGGGGLLQVTYHRTDADYWNWRTNIADGINLFISGLNTANTNLKISASDLEEIASENNIAVSQIVVQTPTADQLMLGAIGNFGPHTINGESVPYYELNQDEEGNYKLVKLKNGGVVITIIKNPNYTGNYVSSVLNIYNGP